MDVHKGLAYNQLPRSVWRYPKCWTIPIPILFSGTKYFRYRYRYFFRYQIFPIPVPRLFSDTKFDRYRFRDFFPVPNFSDTGSDTTIKMKNSRYRYLYGTGTHYKSLKFLNFGNETQFRYQIFPIPVPRLFSGTKFRRYRFRDFLSVPNLTDTGSETFFRYQFVPIPVPIPPKKLKIPGTGNSRYRYVTLWLPGYRGLVSSKPKSPPWWWTRECVTDKTQQATTKRPI